MKKLYFDQNIVIDLQNKRKPALVSAVQKIDKSKHQILFSPAHIEEIAVLAMHRKERQEVIKEKLDFLAELTGSMALLPFKRIDTEQVEDNGIYVSKENPRVTYGRVISQYDRNIIAENHQKEKIENGEDFEKNTGVSSKQTNNINIKGEIDLFKPRLHQIIINNYKALIASGFPGEYLPPVVPGCNEINFEKFRNYFPLHEMAIEKIFEFLENRRYFPDKSTQFLSGLHDTTHAIYAAYCDIFVTNDSKLSKKAAAAFSWLGIETLILSPDELVEYLDV